MTNTDRDSRVSEQEIEALAFRMQWVGPSYERSEEGMLDLAAHLKWRPAATDEWPRAADGSFQGVAGTASAGGTERLRYAYLGADGIVVPVSQVTGDAMAQAEEFRRVSDIAQDALNPASFFGNYSPSQRAADLPAWGTPYMRWRGQYTTIELRAGKSGPEFVSGYTEIWEDDYQSAMVRKPTGFVGAVAGPDRIQHLNFWTASGWDELLKDMTGFLTGLTAELTAFGMSLSLGLYGRIHSEDGTPDSPMLFDVRCSNRLHIGYVGPDAVDAAALGWSRTDPQALLGGGGLEHFEAPWHFDAGGLGVEKAAEAAGLIVETARAAGVREAGDLMLGKEGEYYPAQSRAKYRGPYTIRYPGLRLRTV